MGVKLAAALGGSVELVPTNTASNYTATMPAKTGTVAMDGPAFSAYANGGQSVATGTYAKVQVNTERFDTAGAFNNTGSTVGTAPAYSFNPQVAGYYQVNACVGFVYIAAVNKPMFSVLYKNGSASNFGSMASSTAAYYVDSGLSALVYLNGSTDYLELYCNQGSGVSVTLSTASSETYFQASMVRAA